MSHKYTDPKEAIARSTNHNEIAWLEAATKADAKELVGRIDNDEDVSELEWQDSVLNLDRPIIDVWGKRLGGEFRVYIFWARP